jgi:hypothetical protein
MTKKIAGLTFAMLASVFTANANAGCADISYNTLQQAAKATLASASKAQ